MAAQEAVELAERASEEAEVEPWWLAAAAALGGAIEGGGVLGPVADVSRKRASRSLSRFSTPNSVCQRL